MALKIILKVNVFCLMFFFGIQSLSGEQNNSKSQNSSFLSKIIIYTGGNWGGLIGPLPNGTASNVTEYTHLGANLGVHTEFNISGNFIETGLDYMYYSQDLFYQDASNNISGIRTFLLHALTIPLTYNFHFFNRDDGSPWFVLGLGVFGSWFFDENVINSGSLADYHLNNVDYGVVFNFVFYPFDIQERYLLGIYVIMTRSVNFNDFYSDRYVVWGINAGTASTTFGLTMKF